MYFLSSLCLCFLCFSPCNFFLSFFKIYFICFWLHWVFVAARGLSLVVASMGYSSLRRVGFSLWWLLLFWSMGSRHAGSLVVTRGLWSTGSAVVMHGLSSSTTWDLPAPGLERLSPALAGGLLTTTPPRKPPVIYF